MVGLEFISAKGPRINLIIIAGLLLGIVGTVIIFTRDLDVTVDFNIFLGGICLLGAVISWSVGSIYWKYRQVDVDPFMGASVQMLIAGSLQTALGFILGEQDHFILTQEGFLALGYLIVVGSIFGYASYIYAVRHLPLSLVSTYAYINPVIALVLGWYFLEEPLTITVFIAAVLIFGGVVLVKRGSSLAASKS
jgi:drug/metabolite transporter (DMT)-like permease